MAAVGVKLLKSTGDNTMPCLTPLLTLQGEEYQ